MNPTAATAPRSTTASAPTATSRTPREQLSFRTRRRGGAVILSARGEADAFTLPLWRDIIGNAAEEAARTGGAVIVDTCRLDFLSLRTVAALAEDARRYRHHGADIYLVTTDLHIARLAARDQQTTDLPVRSTVVSALTAIRLRKPTAHTTGRPSPYHPPQITPEHRGTTYSGRTHYLAGEMIPGRGNLPPTVTAAPLPNTW